MQESEEPVSASPIHISECILGSIVGSGAFGTVRRALHVPTCRMVAVKDVRVIDSMDSEMKVLEKELKMMEKLRHTNVVRILGHTVDSDKKTFHIIMEYIAGGSLASTLHEFNALPEPVVVHYTQQILTGLAYLHSLQVMHRDIKPNNLLTDPHGHLRLADFGTARHLSSLTGTATLAGTPAYMAPESVRGSDSLKSDIWGVGCTVLELLTGLQPWHELRDRTLYAVIYHIGNSLEGPTIPANLSEQAKSFLRSCFTIDEDKRPSCSQLLQHPWITHNNQHLQAWTATNKHPSAYSHPIPSHVHFTAHATGLESTHSTNLTESLTGSSASSSSFQNEHDLTVSDYDHLIGTTSHFAGGDSTRSAASPSPHDSEGIANSDDSSFEEPDDAIGEHIVAEVSDDDEYCYGEEEDELPPAENAATMRPRNLSNSGKIPSSASKDWPAPQPPTRRDSERAIHGGGNASGSQLITPGRRICRDRGTPPKTRPLLTPRSVTSAPVHSDRSSNSSVGYTDTKSEIGLSSSVPEGDGNFLNLRPSSKRGLQQQGILTGGCATPPRSSKHESSNNNSKKIIDPPSNNNTLEGISLDIEPNEANNCRLSFDEDFPNPSVATLTKKTPSKRKTTSPKIRK